LLNIWYTIDRKSIKTEAIVSNILLLIILIGVNAFFAAVEIALISLDRLAIQEQVKAKKKNATQVLELVKNPNKFLATIQIGITFAGFLASAFAAERFASPLTQWIISLGVTLSPSVLRTAMVVLITLILSFMTLVFGELVPKRVGLAYSEKVAYVALKPLKLISFLFKPFIYLLSKTTDAVVKLLNVQVNEDDDSVGEHQIRLMIERSAQKGKIRTNERVLINNIFEFDDKTVTDIMTHRTDLVAFEDNVDLEHVMSVLEKEKLSRIPVFHDDLDTIVGVLYGRDVMFNIYGTSNEAFDIKKVMRKPYFVIESKRIDVLLKELQQQQNHLAIIVDEFGGTEGIVTLEDIIEELVGEIFDEDDIEQQYLKKIDDNTWKIDGTASIFDVNRVLKTHIPTNDYDTISGFLLEELGYIPKSTETPSVIHDGYHFSIDKIKSKRIHTITVTRQLEEK
jgi:putative hemolysin